MAEKDPDGPSLELPKLGFGRKRGSKIERETADQPTEVLPPPSGTAGPDLEPEPVRPLYADEAPTRVHPATPQPTVADPAPEAAPTVTEEPAPTPGGERKAPKSERPKRERSLPAIGGIPASLLTGALVGLLTVGLTGAGFRLCEVVQGTSSCGKPGFFLLVAILVVMVYVGRLLLGAFGLPDPGSTSFLGMGLLIVLSLLFLVDVLFEWWMIIAIPVIAMATYALAHWVTTAFVEPADS